MGWVIEAVITWFWVGFVERMSEGKPPWVWVFWMLSPFLMLAFLITLAWLLLT